MRRLLPGSLAGQMAVLLAFALLAAQLINFALILNDRQKLSLSQRETPAITRFANTAADIASAAPELREPVAQDSSRHGARFALAPSPHITAAERDRELETRVANALANAGMRAPKVEAARGPGAADARHQPSGLQVLRFAARLPEGRWIEGRMWAPRRDPLLVARLVAATLLVYLVVLGAAAWGARRLARPLAELTRAAESFGGRSEPEPLTPRGPDDLRQAMAAFNAMHARILSLLDEKDHLLGAIGHDLRTPLASLRIRLETMDPVEDRAAAVAKIEEMAAMLEDILVLARTGRARGEARPMDIAALAEAVVEEYVELGKPVRFVTSPRLVAKVQPDLVRRALRNLIDNALAYSGGATVEGRQTGERIAIAVMDEGPGIPDADKQRVLAPFQRLEASRSRETGGSGLGLAIVRGIAESHGGELTLADNTPRGLLATIYLPAG
jgi:signal transduction histidine kinase